MATFGTVRLLVQKRFPGVDPELRDHYIRERYRSILDEVDWRTLEISAVLQTIAEYITGTVTVINGSTTLSGASTVWTSAMTGRRYRTAASSPIYTVTYVSTTEFTLDRAYEGVSGAALGYRLFQNIYSLAATAAEIKSFRNPHLSIDLDEVSRESFDEAYPARPAHGEPSAYQLHDLDSSGYTTVELYPIPAAVRGLPYRYIERPADLTAVADAIPTWLHAGTLTEGVFADLAVITDQLSAADRHQRNFDEGLNRMRRQEARRRPPRQIQMASRFSSHRRLRGLD